ncbi:MAG: hypothetical protein AAFX06_30675, partial [Planctomycetota bacterium]
APLPVVHGQTADVPVVLVAEEVELLFSHRTKSGLVNMGNSKSVDLVAESPGGVLVAWSLNVTSSRNADINVAKDNYRVRITGKTQTNSGGASGNYEGTLKATFVKPAIPYGSAFPPSKLNLLASTYAMSSQRVIDGFGKGSAGRVGAFSDLALPSGLPGKLSGNIKLVEATTPEWNSPFTLEPNSKYVVIPDQDATIKYSSEKSAISSVSGISSIDGAQLGIPKSDLRLAGLAVLVWDHEPDGNHRPVIVDFPRGKASHVFSVGPYGGSMHFVVVDTFHGDNSGEIPVGVYKMK